MQRYFFVIEGDGYSHEDERGTRFASFDAACAYAARVIRELKESGAYDDPGLTMVVKNASGQVLLSIPF